MFFLTLSSNYTTTRRPLLGSGFGGEQHTLRTLRKIGLTPHRNNAITSPMTKKEKTSDAVRILRDRYVKDDLQRKASVEAERVNAQVARMIHDLRNDAGLTQKELAELVGTTQSAISRLEDADYEGHSLSMLSRIAEALRQKMKVVMSATDDLERDLLLPGERDNRQGILQQFSEDFTFAAKLLRLSMNIAEAFCRERTSQYEMTTKMVIGGILAREIRRFRTIIMVSERGYVENAEILTRSLFEGLLAERFILQSPIPLEECSPGLRSARKELPGIPSGYSREEVHTHLYTARQPFEFKRFRDKGEIDEEIESVMDIPIAHVEQTLGSEWVNTLTSFPFTYSGLTIAQLAESYGARYYDRQVYALQCSAVHANDALSFTSLDESTEPPVMSLDLATDDRRLQQLPRVMQLGAAMFVSLLADVDESFATGCRARIDDLVRRYKAFVQEQCTVLPSVPSNTDTL